MKYKTIGAFKNVQNIPYCKAAVELKVGMGVVLDRVAKTASLPASEDDAKDVCYVVTNINDKPELHNSPETYVVNEGEYVRADDLRTVNGLEIEFAAFEISDSLADLSVGDYLVFGTDGLLHSADETTAADYKIAFRIIEKTAYMDEGILAEIVSQ